MQASAVRSVGIGTRSPVGGIPSGQHVRASETLGSVSLAMMACRGGTATRCASPETEGQEPRS